MPRVSQFTYHLMLGVLAAFIAFLLVIQLALAQGPGYTYPARATKPPRQPVSQGVGLQPAQPLGTTQNSYGYGAARTRQTRYDGYSNGVRSTAPVRAGYQ